MSTRSDRVMLEAAQRVAGASSHYEVMGVPTGASELLIRDARRTLQRMFHPDLSKHPQAHDLMAKVNKAQSVLLDPEQRRIYDKTNRIQAAKCPRCGGSGQVTRQRGFSKKVLETCPLCHGVGV